MGAREVVSTDGESSISARAGGAGGSVFLSYVRAQFIPDQHDSKARVWEEGAVEVLSECCRLHRQTKAFRRELMRMNANHGFDFALAAVTSRSASAVDVCH